VERRRAGPRSPGAPRLERLLKGLQLALAGVPRGRLPEHPLDLGLLRDAALSAAQLGRLRGRHPGAFLLLVLTLIPLGASLVVCLVEVATDRYSYPTQFICYLLVALCPLPGPASSGALTTAPAPRASPAA
jgi:hypothetical protein